MNININKNPKTIGEQLKAIENWLRINADVISEVGHSVTYSYVSSDEHDKVEDNNETE